MPYQSDDSYTMPAGATTAFAGQVIASATWNSIFTDVQAALSHGGGLRVFAARAINFNPSVATDVAISISIPRTGLYIVDKCVITNANANISAAAVGLYSGAGAGGFTIAGSQTLTVTTSAGDSPNSAMALAIYTVTSLGVHSVTPLQFRVIVPNGSAATADVILFVRAI